MIFVSIIVAICLTSSSAAANSSEEAAAPASRRYLRASRGLRPNLTDVYPFAKRPKHGQSNDSVPLDFLDISQARGAPAKPEPDESENNARKLGRKKDNKKKKNKRDERKQEREADEVEDKKKKKNKRDERKQEREAVKVKDRKKKNKRDERKQKREREVEDPQPSGVTRNKRNFFVPLPDEGTNEDFAHVPFSDEGDTDYHEPKQLRGH